MHHNLFRSLDSPDLRWHSIGPSDHCRASFNLITLVGFAPVKERTREEKDRLHDWRGGPPYYLYRPYHWQGEKLSKDKHYSTEAAAKRAGRAIILAWLANAGQGQVIWEAEDTGTHFWAHADGPEIATMYFNPEENENGPKKLRVWFGGTYYTVPFANPDEAKSAVESTWRQWIKLAQERLLSAPNSVFNQ